MADAEVAGELLGCAVHREVETEPCSPSGDFGFVWSSKETCSDIGIKWVHWHVADFKDSFSGSF